MITCFIFSTRRYGKIVFIDLKNRRGPPFAFVEFEEPRDAQDACHALDDTYVARKSWTSPYIDLLSYKVSLTGKTDW